MIQIKNLLLILIASSLFINCNAEKPTDKFPIEKRFWTPEDYSAVITELRFGYDDDEQLPTLDNPETGVVVQKLLDHENFKVILEDEELGIEHKKDMSQKFFNEWKDMVLIYDLKDRKDKYLYEREFVETYNFGLDLQVDYFKIGNDAIVEKSLGNDNSEQVIASNKKTIISNFIFYFSFINSESSFSEEGQQLLAEGIDKYFSKLIDTFPNGDYTLMLNRTNVLLDKLDSTILKESLQRLKIKLVSLNEVDN